jgi:hypothetical protein
VSLFARPDRILRALVRQRFLLTTHQGQTWDGVVMEVDERSIVLREASTVSVGGEKVAADGEVLIPRGDVAYMQRTP